MRTLSLLALAALCACSYEAEKPQIFVQVDGIPAGANRLDVELTDSSGTNPIPYAPSFGPGTTTSLQLALAAPPHPDSFHITVDAYDRQQTKLASGSVDGALPAAATLQITLATVAGLRGVYGAACDFTAGNAPCAGANQCEQYVSTDPASGICTISPCNADTDCPVTSPAAVCVAFPGGTTKACQFDCTNAACPSNLFCHPVPGTGGKSFCQGD
jgi:hypothetical protein